MTYSRTAASLQDEAKSVVTDLADKAGTVAAKAGQRIDEAMASAEKTASAVADHGREAGERVTEVAGNFKSALDRSVKDQPMATLAVAAAVGFVVGAIWKS